MNDWFATSSRMLVISTAFFFQSHPFQQIRRAQLGGKIRICGRQVESPERKNREETNRKARTRPDVSEDVSKPPLCSRVVADALVFMPKKWHAKNNTFFYAARVAPPAITPCFVFSR
jgi:hypothetical protein